MKSQGLQARRHQINRYPHKDTLLVCVRCQVDREKLTASPQPLPSKGKIECKCPDWMKEIKAENTKCPIHSPSPTKEWGEEFTPKGEFSDVWLHTSGHRLKKLISFISSLLKEQELRHCVELIEEIEGMKCKVPPNPNVGAVKFQNDCLLYAGRFNYNKALNDVLDSLERKK